MPVYLLPFQRPRQSVVAPPQSTAPHTRQALSPHKGVLSEIHHPPALRIHSEWQSSHPETPHPENVGNTCVALFLLSGCFLRAWILLGAHNIKYTEIIPQ